MSLPAGLVPALQALAADDGSVDADRARQAIKKMGGEGTPDEARKWLEALGESGGAPSKEEIDAALAVRRGERRGDPVRAHRTLVRAGRRDADRFGSNEDRETITNLRERMGTTREPIVHWEGASLCFPQISREQASRKLASRFEADRPPPGIPRRDMLSGEARDFVASRGGAEGEREHVFGPGIPLRGRS